MNFAIRAIGLQSCTLEAHFISTTKQRRAAISSSILCLKLSLKRIFTDVYMYDPSLREEVQKSAWLLDEKLTELRIRFPTEDYDLVLDIVETKDKKTTRQYYFVNHNTRTLFWLENYNMARLLNEIRGVEEPSHISE